jgi:uncharacterized protein (TIGR00297 family)
MQNCSRVVLVLAMLKADCKSPGQMRFGMTDEMVWRKAIPENRDRQQSRALAWTAGLLLAALTFQTAAFMYLLAKLAPFFVFGTIAISLLFALIVLVLRAATPAGAACGSMICLLLTFWTGSYLGSLLQTGLTPLILLFVLTFAATRMGRQRKAIAGLAEGKRGRNAAQVIANLGIAAVASSVFGIAISRGWGFRTLPIGALALAALAEATADTVSSEIGQAFGGSPIILTTLRRVEPGTDGAISLLGTAAGITAAAIVILAGWWALRLGLREALIALVAACAGLFFDSLLGATVERRGWLGNDLVNFTSTLFATGIALSLFLVLR